MKVNDMKYRIRYSRSLRGRTETVVLRNSLVTIQKGDYVFFGIARCNRKDLFKKTLGRELALNRALDSTTSYKAPETASVHISDDGTMGWCNVKYVRTILRHFEGLDQK